MNINNFNKNITNIKNTFHINIKYKANNNNNNNNNNKINHKLILLKLN